jgi:glycosyltransferase involved in cell wall biosynthesis
MKIKGGKRQEVYPYDAQQPLVSIVIVTFNAAGVLQNAFNSISNQSFKNIELLVFDGASKDGTIDIIRHNENLISYWQSEPDKGIYNAMNKALVFVTGQWVLFLGADDLLLSGFSEIAALLKDDQTIYYGDFIKNGRRHGGKFTAYRLAKSNLCHQNILYPKIVFKKYQYQEKYPISADHYLNMQCWADKDISFEYHPFPIADFSDEGISSLQIDAVLEKDRIKNIKQFLGYAVYLRYLVRQLKLKIKRV